MGQLYFIRTYRASTSHVPRILMEPRSATYVGALQSGYDSLERGHSMKKKVRAEANTLSVLLLKTLEFLSRCRARQFHRPPAIWNSKHE